MKKTFLMIFALVLSASLFAACQPGKTDDNMVYDGDGEVLNPDIVGEVLDVQNENALRVLVDSKSDSITGQIWVTITEDTKFIGADGLETQPEDVESLFVIGETAAFLSDGTIMESYPMQTSAKAVFVE